VLWIGNVLMPTPIWFSIFMPIQIRAQFGIKTSPINADPKHWLPNSRHKQQYIPRHEQ
jgi:hypothetical protein